MPIRRLFLIRHGETEGESRIRYHGKADVPLSTEGRLQMQVVAARMRGQAVDVWAASTLQRSWMSARIASDGAAVRLDADFCEVDFGRWEGRTADEIKARDPEAFEQWQNGNGAFDYPEGETSAAFGARVAAARDRLLADRGRTAAAVLHKGVIRAIVRGLTGEELERTEPELGGQVVLVKRDSGWVVS